MGRALVEAVADALLVGGIGVGVEQRDGDGAAAGSVVCIDCRIDACHVEGGNDRAVGRHAFDDLDDMAPLHQRAGFVDVEVVGLVALLAADDQDVAEALCRHEARGGAFALENGVGCHRRCMQHGADIATVAAGLAQDVLQACDHGAARIGGRCRPLQRDGLLAIVIQQDEIGECAADVKGNTDHQARVLRSRTLEGKSIMSGRGLRRR